MGRCIEISRGKSENLSFSEKGVDEIAKKNISRLYNVLAFYELYQDGTTANSKSKNILDRWIITRLENLVAVSTEGYENYKVDVAVRPLTDFIDDFSVWYLRRSRERFKEERSHLAHQFCARHYRNQLVGQVTNDK